MFTLVYISTALLGVFSLLLGVWSLVKNPSAKVIRLWFFLCMAVTVWCIGYFGLLNSTQAGKVVGAAIYLNIVYLGAVIIPVLFFHFVSEFLFLTKKYASVIMVGYVLAGVFYILTYATKLIMEGVTYSQRIGYHEQPGKLFWVFLLYFFGYSTLALGLLLSARMKSDGIRRKQIAYLIASTIIGFIGGGTNFLLSYTGIFPYGQIFVFLYPLLITYGIFLGEPRIRIR